MVLTDGDPSLPNPSCVEDESHATEEVADQERSNVGPQLRVEDGLLALNLLERASSQNLVDSHPCYPHPHEIYSNQRQHREGDDNLCILVSPVPFQEMETAHSEAGAFATFELGERRGRHRKE